MNSTDEILLLKLAEPITYKWRVQSFSKNKSSATCVAYIDSRDVQDRLDEVTGGLWQSDYKEVKGNLFAGIALYINDQWIWKWDCGTESREDKEKGEASDSFKRAAVKWGIGRFLYSLKIRYVTANVKKSEGVWPHVVDDKGKQVWDLTNHIGGEPIKQDQKGILKFFEVENDLDMALKELDKCTFFEELHTVWNSFPDLHKDRKFIDSTNAKKKKLASVKKATA